MATSKKRITANLSDENAEYVRGIALSHGKTMAWAVEKIIEEHKAAVYDTNKPGRQQERTIPDYDEDNRFIEKK